jgi:hypothetical protein
MKVLYIGNHDQEASNDDEGAITYALSQCGHTVERLREKKGHKAYRVKDADLVLFHKWHDLPMLKNLTCKKVFWYFDLVYWPDPLLAGRNKTRMSWMQDIVPLVDLGFCTDGDWVSRDKTGKLIHLTQGADSRKTGMGIVPEAGKDIDILFTGIAGRGGRGRGDFVDEMQATYGDRFKHVSHGVHGASLRDLIARSKIVVAPDCPVTDRYWSNRVYLTLGFGGFLLHPYCEQLAQHYTDGKEIAYYRSRQELHELIAIYLHKPGADDRNTIQRQALWRAAAEHTYTHRVQQLMHTVEQRL